MRAEPPAFNHARIELENTMHVEFIDHVSGPERHVCDAELIFDEADAPLAGMKLCGFSLWQSPDGDLYVTFPSRAFGAGNERRYFEYLRSAMGDPAQPKRVKEWILAAFRQQRQADVA